MANTNITEKPIRDPAPGQYIYAMQDIPVAGRMKKATGWVAPDKEPKKGSPNLVTSEGTHAAIEAARKSVEDDAMMEDRDNLEKYKMKWFVKDGHPAVEFTKEEE